MGCQYRPNLFFLSWATTEGVHPYQQEEHRRQQTKHGARENLGKLRKLIPFIKNGCDTRGL